MSILTKEMLKEANAALNGAAVKIRGKDYIQVKDRVAAFRAAVPGGTILTDIVFQNEERVIMKATIYDLNGGTIATGHAARSQQGTRIRL